MKKADLLNQINELLGATEKIRVESNIKLFLPDFENLKVPELKDIFKFFKEFMPMARDYQNLKRHQPEEAWKNFELLNLHHTPEMRSLKQKQVNIRKYFRKCPETLRRKNEEAKTKNE